MDHPDIPDSLLEKAQLLENLLVDVATGGGSDQQLYQQLRREFMEDELLKALLPDFVRTHRNFGSFWPFIKKRAGTYAERREIIGSAFTPLIDHLESQGVSPTDPLVSEQLEKFDKEAVQRIWLKALDRRKTDPEGAITAARTLMETVIKHILDARKIEYTKGDDLPALYKKISGELKLAPSEHSEVVFKQILGSLTNVVNNLGTLRNQLSDSHGHGKKAPARPTARHAEFAVNLAGSYSVFLIQTHEDRK